MSLPAGNLRKAAILVATLDRPLADRVLACLVPEQADQIRHAVASIGSLPRAEREAALESFIAASSAPAPADSHGGGVEIDASLAALLDGGPVRPAPRDEPLTAEPFRFLENADATRLVRLLEREHPQTVAVVLASLTSHRASELLCRLPGNMQLDVLRRMSSLEPGDPQSVEAIASELEAWAASHQYIEQRRERGLAAVREILAATAQQGHHELADRIRECDTDLARRLGIDRDISAGSGCPLPPRPVSPRPTATAPARLGFAELADLGDAAWSRLLSIAEPELIVLALAGADPLLVERVASQLPSAGAAKLRDSLTRLGPTRLTDVQIARDELARLATRLPPAA